MNGQLSRHSNVDEMETKRTRLKHYNTVVSHISRPWRAGNRRIVLIVVGFLSFDFPTAMGLTLGDVTLRT